MRTINFDTAVDLSSWVASRAHGMAMRYNPLAVDWRLSRSHHASGVRRRRRGRDQAQLREVANSVRPPAASARPSADIPPPPRINLLSTVQKMDAQRRTMGPAPHTALPIEYMEGP